MSKNKFAQIKIHFEEENTGEAPAVKRSRALMRLHMVLEALVSVDTLYLKAHPETKPLYEHEQLAVRAFDDENLHDVASVCSMGAGTPVDLACWRVAELRLAGLEDVHLYFKETIEGGCAFYDASVRIGDMIENPAKIFAVKKVPA